MEEDNRVKPFSKQYLSAMAILLDQLTDEDIKQWAESINDTAHVEFLKEGSKKVFNVQDYTVLNKTQRVFSYYFVLNSSERSKKYPIVFYAQVQKSTSRNNMFKQGMHQSLIWKAVGFPFNSSNNSFALDFLEKILSSTNELLMTDMKQTYYGRTMWVRLLQKLYQKYDCYYALSAPSDAKCVVKIEKLKDIDHYEDDIVQPESQYAYRTAFVLKKGTNPKTVLKDPQHTLILTCEEAEDLGAFQKSIPLTKAQEEGMFDEYYKK